MSKSRAAKATRFHKLSITAVLTFSLTVGGSACFGEPSAYAESGNCDWIKHKMDYYTNNGQYSTYGALGYISLFGAAVAGKCGFIHSSNPYHVNAWHGEPFQLQSSPESWDSRGTKMKARYGYLWSNDLNRKGGYEGYKDDHDTFRFVPTGRYFGGRSAYFFLVNSGPEEGKCLESQWGDGGRLEVAARTCGAATDEWTLGNVSHWYGGSKGHAIDDFSAHGSRLGVLDVPDHKGEQRLIIHPWQESNNQIFHFRPLGYR
ncbi:hypothetical protein ACFQ6V_17215 [Streptomyces roseifaciens]